MVQTCLDTKMGKSQPNTYLNEEFIQTYLDTIPDNYEKMKSYFPTQPNTEDTRNRKYVPLSTNLWLKQKRRMLYFPMDFGELTIVGFIDWRIIQYNPRNQFKQNSSISTEIDLWGASHQIFLY